MRSGTCPAQVETAWLRILLLVISLAALTASFYPGWHLWGLDSLRVFSIPVRVGFVLLLLLSLIPQLGAGLSRVLRLRQDSAAAGGRRIALAVAAALFLLAAAMATSANHLLGDGYTLLKNVQRGMLFSPTEPLDYLLHHGVYALLPAGDLGALWSYRISSWLAGLLFLLLLLAASRGSHSPVLAIAAASTFAAVQFFFGYVESYTYAFLFAFAYLLSSRSDLSRGRVSWQTWLFLALAVGFHLSSLALLPSLVYLVVQCYRSWSVATLTAVASSVALILGIVFAASRIEVGQILVPFGATRYNPYHLLSAQHLGDMLNVVLLNLPLLPLILTLLLLKRKLAYRWFYLLALVPALLFTFFVDPKIGALRDWDLLALASAPALAALLAILASWFRANPARTGLLAAPLLIFGIIHSGSWIVANTSAETSYAYVREVIAADVHYSPHYYQAYRNKSWATLVSDAFADYDEAARAGRIRFQAAPDDQFNRYNLAMHYFFHSDHLEEAAELLSGNWWGLTTDAQKVLNAAGVFRKTGHEYEEGQVLAAFIERGGSNYLVFFNYARWLARVQRPDEAAVFYERALDIWPDVPLEPRFEYCRFLLENDPGKRALEYLSALALSLRGREQRLAVAAASALAAGDTITVDSLIFELSQLLQQ